MRAKVGTGRGGAGELTCRVVAPFRALTSPADAPTPLPHAQVYPIIGLIGFAVTWVGYTSVYQIVNNPDSVK